MRPKQAKQKIEDGGPDAEMACSGVDGEDGDGVIERGHPNGLD